MRASRSRGRRNAAFLAIVVALGGCYAIGTSSGENGSDCMKDSDCATQHCVVNVCTPVAPNPQSTVTIPITDAAPDAAEADAGGTDAAPDSGSPRDSADSQPADSDPADADDGASG